MNDIHEIRQVAVMRSAFKQKYGIPRQPRLVQGLKSEVVFGDEFNNPDAVRGLEEFSHIWLIWGFSDTKIDMTEEHPAWKPTVRPPRLGGDIRKGVFATRSPYRPNSLGISAVKLLEIRDDNGQLRLIVEGADLLDGTPIYDIKPYIPYSDIITEADEGFAKSIDNSIDVEFPDDLLAKVDEEFRAPLIRILELDPRDAYDRDSAKPCKMAFVNVDIEFVFRDGRLVVTAVNEL
ncbi:tRNA (N6-threonylcarbamoyladenosine(37)-N6)-methyltransferase TrmO [Mogibacterium diversum]|uniref:tRNA (N6-threonylcarbamoyladenosine(37)-N6)-methyltransferase TrmO n=1 Tax=Mogibacterium diversum TaxID=114527 RepID=A0A2S0L4C5_9FIRM|nr:tRNA (N6-threonylcarbamoyladenosine(37)-N6)-methyltransferase TrmO [Mogibacterium diversum]AVM48148.1 tRNA (N6-threonylcarbamoyladenosine(37)-N6)-methyltransferase TrmO [Mogibacterium diversum]